MAMEITSNVSDIPSQEILRSNINGGDVLPKKSCSRKGAVKKKKKQFECKICGKVFKNKYNLRSHSQIHTELCSFNCDLCPYKGKTRKYLSRHKKKCHSKPTSNECKFCRKKFHYKSTLVKHLWVHTGEKPYKCEICGKAFNTRYSLNTHNFIHTDKKPYQCTTCDYACRDSSTLRKHQARHTGLVKLYKCKMCDKSYKVKWKLKAHVADAHLELDVRKYVCDDCGKCFKWKTNLTNHIQSVHAKLRACVCELCGASLSNRGNLHSHMRRHVDVRPYRCVHGSCRKTFKTTCGLRKHSSIHSPQYRCDSCGRMFSRRNRRDAHIARKCKRITRTSSQLQCGRCPDTFHSKRILAAHMKTHDVVKVEFICDSCDHVTYSKIGITEHIKFAHSDGQMTLCDTSKMVSRELSQPIGDYQNRKKGIEEEGGVEVKIESIELELQDMPENISDVCNTEGNEDGTLTERHAKTTIQDNVKNLKQVPEKVFDEFFISRSVTNKHAFGTGKKKKRSEVDVKKNEYVKECVKGFLSGSNEVETKRTGRDRRCTIRRAVMGKERDVIKRDLVGDIGDSKSDGDNNEKSKGLVDDEVSSAGVNLKVNFHQCYVCFKLFSTKTELLGHCKDHFDVCSESMLTRCPLCQYVTKKDIKRHMREKHDLELDIPFSRIKEKKHNNGSSRYCFEVDNTVLEVIPSVKNLNKIESMKLDKRRRELREKLVGKTRLVKKGSEWIVEKVGIDKSEYVLPVDFDYDNDEEYLEKIREFSRRAKIEGKKVLFPCNVCEKKCQSFSALKLHFRRHEDNPKPFKPKRWKHKGDVQEEKTVSPSSNRLKRPKPIVTKHKCDKSLMEFYKNNIRGGDIEFWQFLKIYNKMSRENVKEFEDLEKRTDFGIHNIHSSEVGVNKNIDGKGNTETDRERVVETNRLRGVKSKTGLGK